MINVYFCNTLYKYTKNLVEISSILPCDFLEFRGIINIRQNWLQEGDETVHKIGDLVVYGIHGVCRIAELQVQVVNRKKVEYFVLEPLSQAGSKYFVPSQNEIAVSKLRPILSKTEIESLLNSEVSHVDCWIGDENLRKQHYKDLIASGDRGALISMLRALQKHKILQTESGKKFHISDANFMRDAEKVICSEFSLVLNISNEQVVAYIYDI